MTVGGVVFTFTSTATGSNGPTEIEVGSTLSDTLDNAVSKINSYFGTGFGAQSYALNQVEAHRDGTNIIISDKTYGQSATDLATGAVLTSALTGPTGSAVSGAFNNSTNNGINTNGVTNKDFIGKITSPFVATYNSVANTVNLSITIGNNTYSALNVTTNPAANTSVRFTSYDGGGYFDAVMQGSKGMTVSTQTDANTFAQRMSSAIGGLDFYQKRTVENYSPTTPIFTDNAVTGSLIGTKLDIQGDDFDGMVINDVQVNAPQGASANGSIVFTINGEQYATDPNVGKKLGANSVFTLTDINDQNKTVEFRTGNTAIDFSTDAKALSFENALKTSLGVGKDGVAVTLQFQVGVTTEDTMKINLGNASTRNIYGGESLDVLTQANAAHASDVLDEAIHKITSIRADVGSLQSRFNFASNNIESSIQNQDAARGVLLDTDVSSESTAYATAQVQLQAGIAVLAQANLLPQNLLKLIG